MLIYPAYRPIQNGAILRKIEPETCNMHECFERKKILCKFVQMSVINLIRLPNLLILCLMMSLTAWMHAIPFSAWLLAIMGSVICVAAAGNVWNDICDVRTDAINKPHKNYIRNLPRVRYLYLFLNIVGWLLAVISAIQGYYFTILFVFPASLLLYVYSTHLKPRPVWGNLLVSLLSALPLIMIMMMARDSLIPEKIRLTAYYAIFAFLLSWIREVAKDIEDIPGDVQAGYRTLPITGGVDISKTFMFVLIALLTVHAIRWTWWLTNWQLPTYILFCMAFIILLPLPIFVYLIFSAHEQNDYRRLGLALKGWMLAGVLSMILWV
ncbi:MAG: geranylgeranylglycerol-phosphate geranylgeranyltransferase [Candidatus Competibacteraceae bacterium]|nr:geranylgeranylglycerol-phosphate geranylgeranyltransferase [Candidatus Competibacteraceae bacterium]